MRGTQERLCPDANERAGVASSGGGWVVALPTWESFQEEDRRRLVQAILQTARRQVGQAGPADRLRGK
jgi:hypothetical protein